MPDHFDLVIAGAGVIGLAVARQLAQAGRQVLVLEAEAAAGTVTSARNSEVVHAGLYYPSGTLRARLCAAGKHALYAYCASRGVAVRRCGKLIVAANGDEEPVLAAIAAQGARNGVDDLEMITAAQATCLEPALRCTAALFSPSTGIVDSHGYMLALRADAEAAGALFVFRTPVTHVTCGKPGFLLRTGGAEPAELRCDQFINAAGLGAVALGRATVGLPHNHVPPAYLSKGSYFTLSQRAPFSRLIYPVPIPGGAGVHLTLDLGGRARFGPDVEPVTCIDYAVDPRRAEVFYAAIRRYWPGLPDGALLPDYAGIRPKIVPAYEAQDFMIQGAAIHGVRGLVNLFGIESPGLTASLAVAGEVERVLGHT